MQLGDHAGAGTPPYDIADAVRRGGARLGHRPAVTVLHPGARYEQSGASLANWATKGAHLLELDHLVGPGGTVDLVAPACWTSASVALAAWWLGAAVHLDPAATVPTGSAPARSASRAAAGTAAVRVQHETVVGTAGGGTILLVGDGLDGGPTGSASAPVWTHEAQPMPDAPPPAAAGADRLALTSDVRRWTQRELLALADDLGDGVLGVEVDRVDPALALVATAVRPFLTGHATVVLRDVGRDAAVAERVSVWCPASDG
ncbi:MAG: hypothetical protein ACNA8R_07085 [Nitriliruptoraceae bacterium]